MKTPSAFPARGATAALVAGLGILLAPLLAATPDDPRNLPQAMAASFLSALVFTAGSFVFLRRESSQNTLQMDAPTLAFVVLVLLAAASIAARLTHGAAYLGPMLRAWATLTAQFGLFLLARLAARSGRSLMLAVTLCAVAGAAIVAGLGVGEYMTHFAAGERDWRILATSTPDFLAAFFVVTLPVTLALFLGAPAANRLPFLFGVALVLQLAALLLTGSRFALISLTVGFLTFGLALWRAGRTGMRWDAASRKRAVGLLVIVGIVGLAAARPVVNRLTHGEANSGAFRAWTWRGTVKMIQANPIFGTGIGTFVHLYPKYALTGFTRLAHNGYLQTAAETGIPALLVLVVTLGLTGAAGTTALIPPSPFPQEQGKGESEGRLSETFSPLPFLGEGPGVRAIFPADERLLLAGLLGGLAAGATQNLIDSDWSVYFVGVTFWTLAGLTVGLCARPEARGIARPARPIFAVVGSALAAALGVFALTGGVAAWFGQRGMEAANPADAASAFAAAAQLDPLNSRYPSNLAYRVAAPTGDLTRAETLLRHAARLEPSPFNFGRLGDVLEREGREADALAAYRQGLDADPNFVTLLLLLAEKSPPPSNLDYYRRLSALELSPVGTVRAIGGVTETAFAVADSVLADAQPADALALLTRASRLLESYAGEGGSTRRERLAQSGGRPDPARDKEMADLYQSVMTRLERLQTGPKASELERRRVDYQGKFDGVIKQAEKTGSSQNP